jgi:hypothetical protein
MPIVHIRPHTRVWCQYTAPADPVTVRVEADVPVDVLIVGTFDAEESPLRTYHHQTSVTMDRHTFTPAPNDTWRLVVSSTARDEPAVAFIEVT